MKKNDEEKEIRKGYVENKIEDGQRQLKEMKGEET